MDVQHLETRLEDHENTFVDAEVDYELFDGGDEVKVTLYFSEEEDGVKLVRIGFFNLNWIGDLNVRQADNTGFVVTFEAASITGNLAQLIQRAVPDAETRAKRKIENAAARN